MICIRTTFAFQLRISKCISALWNVSRLLWWLAVHWNFIGRIRVAFQETFQMVNFNLKFINVGKLRSSYHRDSEPYFLASSFWFNVLWVDCETFICVNSMCPQISCTSAVCLSRQFNVISRVPFNPTRMTSPHRVTVVDPQDWLISSPIHLTIAARSRAKWRLYWRPGRRHIWIYSLMKSNWTKEAVILSRPQLPFERRHATVDSLKYFSRNYIRQQPLNRSPL